MVFTCIVIGLVDSGLREHAIHHLQYMINNEQWNKSFKNFNTCFTTFIHSTVAYPRSDAIEI